MLSVSSIKPKLSLFLFFLIVSIFTFSQENSPFSRYGLGDVYSSQNILNRGMGGITSTFSNGTSVNFSNPASYSDFTIVTYDLGLTIDSRTLKSANPVLKYNSVNFLPSYIALGLPLSRKKHWGLTFGLKPITRVSYSIEESKRNSFDSIYSLYQGDGGLYQFFVGIGKRWNNLRIGLNTGYMFGRKENSTRTFVLDTVLTYNSKSTATTTYGNAFLSLGLMYDAQISKSKVLRFGMAGNLKQSLNAKQQLKRETFTYNSDGGDVTIDSVYHSEETRGSIKLPMSYNAGVSLNSSVFDKLGGRYDRSTLALEYESTKWSDFRYYDQPDKLVNSWTLRAGWQFTPNPLSVKSYWNKVIYRTGFYYGKDAVNAETNTMPVYAFTLGAGFPLRRWRSYEQQYTVINTTFEIGKRGSSKNNITESFYRISFGLNLSDVGWFVKRREL